jgi:hypothetical protein
MPTLRELASTEAEALTPPAELLGRSPVPFGLYHIDAAYFRGVEPDVPQLYAIQGGPGHRKTTLLLNILANMCLSGLLVKPHWIGIDVLESGMTIERYELCLKGIIASKLIIYRHWTGDIDGDSIWKFFGRELPSRNGRAMSPGELCDIRSVAGRPELILNPDFIKGAYYKQPGCDFSPLQKWAWDLAHEIIADFPLVISGVSEHHNMAERRRRYVNVTNIEQSFERWLNLHKEHAVKQLVVDYLQRYFIPDTYSHYEKQLRVVPYFAEWVQQTGGCAWVLSQEGVGHQRDARSNYGEVFGSSGGDILMAESQTNIRLEYYRNRNPNVTLIYGPVKARRGSWPDFGVFTEPFSGAFFGKTMTFEDLDRLGELPVSRRKK